MSGAERAESAAARRQAVLDMIAHGTTMADVARALGVSRQRVHAMLRAAPPEAVEAAKASGAGLVRCPHCGVWVQPNERGPVVSPDRHR